MFKHSDNEHGNVDLSQFCNVTFIFNEKAIDFPIF